MRVDPITRRWITSEADEKAAYRGCTMNERLGMHVINFFCRDLRHTIGKWAGKPFEPLDWQATDILMPLFGWQKPNGTRRFREAYLEVPKKTGKSTMASGIACYMARGDCEPGAHVYCAGYDSKQAMTVWREAANMAKASPALSPHCKRYETGSLVFPDNNSFIKTVSRESRSAEGWNIHCLIFDELHTQKTRDLWDALYYGGASREQPLIFVITTAGYDQNSICYEQHTYAENIASGVYEDDEFFGYICTVDDKEKWKEPAQWEKANPSYGITFSAESFKKAADQAIQVRTKENSFKRYRLNIWTEQADRWLSLDEWDSCKQPKTLDDLKGARCWGGFDKAEVRDLCAYVLCFPDHDWYLLPFFWAPRDNAADRQKRDRVPYLTWAAQQLITLTPGRVIDEEFLEKKMADTADMFDLQDIGFDPHAARQFAKRVSENHGIEMVEFSQKAAVMNEPCNDFDGRLGDQRVTHDGHPILRWCVANAAVKENAGGEIHVDKLKSNEKVDGLVASVMAVARAAVNVTEEESDYVKRARSGEKMLM